MGHESGVLWPGGCEMCRPLDQCSASPEMNTGSGHSYVEFFTDERGYQSAGVRIVLGF